VLWTATDIAYEDITSCWRRTVSERARLRESARLSRIDPPTRGCAGDGQASNRPGAAPGGPVGALGGAHAAGGPATALA
jgi:hypothetical protein